MSDAAAILRLSERRGIPAIPVFVVGLYVVQRLRIGRLGRLSAFARRTVLRLRGDPRPGPAAPLLGAKVGEGTLDAEPSE